MKDEAEMKSKLAYAVERESIVWVEINVAEVEVFIIVDACLLTDWQLYQFYHK